MAKEYDYRANIIKLVGKDIEFVFNPVKVNNDAITRVTTYEGILLCMKTDSNTITSK